MDKLIYIVIIIYFLSFTSSAQTTTTLKNTEPSTIAILGSSNLHDWTSNVKKTNAVLIINKDTDNLIEKLIVNFKVTDIKSHRKKMDKLIYKSLNSIEHPTITFQFTEAKLLNKNLGELKLIGNLTIAGITKSVSILTKIKHSDSHISLSGNYPLKMSEYGISPPSTFLNIFKSKDDIAIDFDLTF